MTRQSENTQQQYVTRTRQDLINSGDLFRMNEKFAKDERARNNKLLSRRLKSSGVGGVGGGGRSANKGSQASECCYSICNLALIIATVITLVLLIKFFRDEPLYEYGEYLLGLAFYRQLIFVITLMPLIMLLPIYNALSVLVQATLGDHDNRNTQHPYKIDDTHLSNHQQQQQQQQNGELASEKRYGRGEQSHGAILRPRLAYQFVMFLLVLLALVFVCPYISEDSVASYIEIEFKRHLRARYERDLSYQLLDRIQEQYQCCDHLWYRANLRDQVPLTCFVPNSNFKLIYDETCPDVLGELVSFRCAIISACLFAILLALGCLFAIDVVALLNRPPSSGRSSFSRRAGDYEISKGNGHAIAPPTGATGDNKNARDSNALARTSDAIRPHEQRLLMSAGDAAQTGARAQASDGEEEVDDTSDDNLSARLRAQVEERERAVPLLSRPAAGRRLESSLDNDELAARREEEEEERSSDASSDSGHHELSSRLAGASQQAATNGGDPPILLTRADYRTIARQRSQSPVFLSAPTTGPSSRAPIKSALRQSGEANKLAPREPELEVTRETITHRESYRRLESTFDSPLPPPPPPPLVRSGPDKSESALGRSAAERDGGDVGDDDDSLVSDYTERVRKSDSLLRQKQALRRDQLRKSLQSVRFADDNLSS